MASGQPQQRGHHCTHVCATMLTHPHPCALLHTHPTHTHIHTRFLCCFWTAMPATRVCLLPKYLQNHSAWAGLEPPSDRALVGRSFPELPEVLPCSTLRSWAQGSLSCGDREGPSLAPGAFSLPAGPRLCPRAHTAAGLPPFSAKFSSLQLVPGTRPTLLFPSQVPPFARPTANSLPVLTLLAVQWWDG